MTHQTVEVTWLDARETLSLDELARCCGLSAPDLDELVAYGALSPVGRASADDRFSAVHVPPLRVASRLRRDFDLDLFTVALLLGYLRQIEGLEQQLRSLQAAMPANPGRGEH